MRYSKTQALYLSRKGVLPEIVDVFGMSEDDGGDDDGIWDSGSDEAAEKPQEAEEAEEEDDDDDVDDLFE